MSDAAPQVVERCLGDSYFENEQRDRDREHAVTERLRPARAPAVAHSEPFTACATAPARSATLSIGSLATK